MAKRMEFSQAETSVTTQTCEVCGQPSETLKPYRGRQICSTRCAYQVDEQECYCSPARHLFVR